MTPQRITTSYVISYEQNWPPELVVLIVMKISRHPSTDHLHPTGVSFSTGVIQFLRTTTDMTCISPLDPPAVVPCLNFPGQGSRKKKDGRRTKEGVHLAPARSLRALPSAPVQSNGAETRLPPYPSRGTASWALETRLWPGIQAGPARGLQ